MCAERVEEDEDTQEVKPPFSRINLPSAGCSLWPRPNFPFNNVEQEVKTQNTHVGFHSWRLRLVPSRLITECLRSLEHGRLIPPGSD